MSDTPRLPPLPDAVRWFEGMRLAPQHFQQQSARLEMLPAVLAQARDPLHWGILHLEMRQDDQVLTVVALDAVMPDGLVVSVTESDGLRVDLATVEPVNGLWRVALGVPAAGPQGTRRYLDQGVVRREDANPGGACATLSVLRPNLQLVAGAAPGFVTHELLPLGHWSKGGGAPGDTGYLPPWLRVSRTMPLYAPISRLCAKLRGNYATLAAGAAGNEQQQSRHLALLPQLGARLLELEAVLRTETAHPYTLFQMLAGLLGALSGALPGTALAPLPAFDYRDLGAAFTPLLAALDMRRTALALDYNWAQFTRQEGTQIWEIDLAGRALHLPLTIALDKPLRASPDDMITWLDAALVSSVGRDTTARHLRAPGIGKAIFTGPHAMEMGASETRTLFTLDLSGEAAACFDSKLPLRIVGVRDRANGYPEPQAIALLLSTEAEAT